jgi:hypothetical protein
LFLAKKEADLAESLRFISTEVGIFNLRKAKIFLETAIFQDEGSVAFNENFIESFKPHSCMIDNVKP